MSSVNDKFNHLVPRPQYFDGHVCYEVSDAPITPAPITPASVPAATPISGTPTPQVRLSPCVCSLCVRSHYDNDWWNDRRV